MSRISFWLCAALLIATTIFYYPKWKQTNTEATISWDVSGYYLYLPAALIYKDIKQLDWWSGVAKQYNPGPGMGQAFRHPSGNYVMKYPMGQALQFLPWFLTAHVLAEPLGLPCRWIFKAVSGRDQLGQFVGGIVGLVVFAAGFVGLFFRWYCSGGVA